VEGKKGFLARQKEQWRSFIFRAPSRRRWGLVAALGMIYFGLPAEDPRTGLTDLPPLGILKGMGTLFGSLAELMPEEQTTLAGILRVWAGLFVACGFGLLVIGTVLGPDLARKRFTSACDRLCKLDAWSKFVARVDRFRLAVEYDIIPYVEEFVATPARGERIGSYLAGGRGRMSLEWQMSRHQQVEHTEDWGRSSRFRAGPSSASTS
jgi:hypothetical protein